MRVLLLSTAALFLIALAVPAVPVVAQPTTVDVRVRVATAPPAPAFTTLAPPAAMGGCYGRQAGCVGYTAGCTGYARPVGYVPVYGAGCVGSAAGPRYGDRLAPGIYATPSGRPAAPGILSVPGDGWPYDGPIRRGLRAAAGYDR